MNRRRVAVTGLGVVSSCGIGAPAFWEGLHRPPTPGEVLRIDSFDPAPYFDNPKEVRRADRFQQFAAAAAQEAVGQAGDFVRDASRVATMIGTGIGGLATIEEQSAVCRDRGPRRVSPFLIPMVMGNAPAAAISMRYGFQGPCESVATACATGTHAIGNAARLIMFDRCDAAVAGSTEAAITETGVAGFRNMTALTSSGVSAPFDAHRDGFVMSEGAAVVVLEEWEAARTRGATILAEVLGGASSADAHHITAPAPKGAGAIGCMRLALQEAGLDPAEIAQVNAHGTSTPRNDEAEALAIASLFGYPGPPVTSIKGVTGHALGAAGAIEAVAVVISMMERSIPPTLGYRTPDPDLPSIDIVTEPRVWTPGPTISNSFGFGGHNGCLVLAPS